MPKRGWTLREWVRERTRGQTKYRYGSAAAYECTDCEHRADDWDHYDGYGPGKWRMAQAVCRPCHVARTNARGGWGVRSGRVPRRVVDAGTPPLLHSPLVASVAGEGYRRLPLVLVPFLISRPNRP